MKNPSLTKIFVVGSINVDFCSVVQSAPKVGETVLASNFEMGLGGKGANQAVACAKLGGSVHMIGAVGDDSFGSFTLQQLTSCGINCDGVSILNTKRTGMAFVTVCNGDNSIVVAPNANQDLDFLCIKKYLSFGTNSDILVLQLELDLGVVAKTLEFAKSIGMTTVLNVAPANIEALELLKFVDICVLNETECQVMSGVEPKDEVSVVLAVSRLYQFGASKVVLTLGEQGSVVVQGKVVDFVPAVATNVVDTTSAGDAFVGAMVTTLIEGGDLVEAAKLGSKVASVAVSRRGASCSIPHLKDLT